MYVIKAVKQEPLAYPLSELAFYGRSLLSSPERESNLSVCDILLFPSCKSAYLRVRHSPAYKHSWEMNACAGSMEWWHTTNSSCYRAHFVEHTFLWTKLQLVFTTCQRARLWCRPNMSTHFVLCSRLQQCLRMTWALSPCQFSAFCVW